MEKRNTFTWPADVDGARHEQLTLAPEIRTSGCDGTYQRGLAIGTAYEENTSTGFAAGLWFTPDGATESAGPPKRLEQRFPYIPGMLAFRVGPAICSLLEEIDEQPEILLLDGQGVAHELGIGLAAHIGLLFDTPSIGVTSNRLFGEGLEPTSNRLDSSRLLHPTSGSVVGYAVRTTPEKCCWISAGHRLSQKIALDVVRDLLRLSDRPLPHPVLQARTMAWSEASSHWSRKRRPYLD